MESIEFLNANNKDCKVKFINILKDVTNVGVAKLSENYNDLLNSKSVIIEFNIYDLKKLNKIVIDIMEMNISIGNCSFHEEKNPQLRKEF